MTSSLLTFLVAYSTGFILIYNLVRVLTNKDYSGTALMIGGGGGGGGDKSGGGSAPAMPAPPPPAAPPPTEDAEVVRQKAEGERRRAAAAKGYSSTDLTNGVFAGGNSEDVKKPTLLGGA